MEKRKKKLKKKKKNKGLTNHIKLKGNHKKTVSLPKLTGQ